MANAMQDLPGGSTGVPLPDRRGRRSRVGAAFGRLAKGLALAAAVDRGPIGGAAFRRGG